MRSGYSTAKVLFLFLLVLVEASWGLSLEEEDPSFNENYYLQNHPFWKHRSYQATRLRHGNKRDFKSRVKAHKLAPRDPALHPHANVDIRWDMTNERDGSYSANVTISNYVMDHEIEQPWKLAFIWVKKKTLLSTLGTQGTQHGFVSVGEDDTDTYCLNNVTFVGLPRQNDPLCIGGSSLIKDDIAKSSTSFQIYVSHFNNRGDRAHESPSDATLTTRGFEYNRECDSMEQVIDAHLNTWSTTCILSISKTKKFHEIHNNNDEL